MKDRGTETGAFPASYVELLLPARDDGVPAAAAPVDVPSLDAVQNHTRRVYSLHSTERLLSIGVPEAERKLVDGSELRSLVGGAILTRRCRRCRVAV